MMMMMMHRDDGVDSDVDSVEEGFRLLLGGVSISTVSGVEWKEEETETETVIARGQQSNSALRDELRRPATSASTGIRISLGALPEDDSDSTWLFSDAFHVLRDGRIVCTPPVRVVNLSSVDKRGNCLVATRSIRAGEVIFTERAITATQIPSGNGGNGAFPAWKSSLFLVRACQHCFRSLEPVSSCSSSQDRPSLPMTHLWPIPEYEEDGGDDDPKNGRHCRDRHGRQQCKQCSALFCTETCSEAHAEAMGSCCDCTAAIQAAVHSFRSKNRAQESDDDEIDDAPPSVLLATRLLCIMLRRYRSEGYVGLGPVQGMCGEPEDITPLELGIETTVDDEDEIVFYSLSDAYEAVCNSLSVTDAERKVFSLNAFHRLAAVSARNGFAITTQSPFRAYHGALLRASGGRGTEKHTEVMEKVALALGSDDGLLHREMDRQVMERCAAHVAAIFRLTSRINHSCDPNAEVRSQEFVDCCIDVVARREIQPGEEITISYIQVGPSAGRSATDRSRRMRELRAKYLFVCDCPRCVNK